METTITIPQRLVPKILEVSQKEGYKKIDDFIIHILEEKIAELYHRMKTIEITDRVRDRLTESGIPEEEIQAEFNKFRDQA